VSIAGETSVDWLDDHCWACGSAEVEAHDRDRVLCPPCRRMLSGPPPADDSVRAIHHLYWLTHPLERCWRCLTGTVDQDDELGLCPPCRRAQGR